LNKDIKVEKILKRCLEMVEGLEEYLENTSPLESVLQKRLFIDSMKIPWEDINANNGKAYKLGIKMLSSRHSCKF